MRSSSPLDYYVIIFVSEICKSWKSYESQSSVSKVSWEFLSELYLLMWSNWGRLKFLQNLAWFVLILICPDFFSLESAWKAIGFNLQFPLYLAYSLSLYVCIVNFMSQVCSTNSMYDIERPLYLFRLWYYFYAWKLKIQPFYQILLVQYLIYSPISKSRL